MGYSAKQICSPDYVHWCLTTFSTVTGSMLLFEWMWVSGALDNMKNIDQSTWVTRRTQPTRHVLRVETDEWSLEEEQEREEEEHCM
jgi:hypothetical protein